MTTTTTTSTRGSIPSVNPATGETIGVTELNTVADLNNAVSAAHKVQPAWEAAGYKERRRHLLLVRDYIVENAESLAEIISRDTGKTKIDALSTEVMSAAMAISYYAAHAVGILKRKRLSGGSLLTFNKRSYVDRVPAGVVGIISPWNYPFAIPFHEVAMALITGNAVILKVASQTLMVGKAIQVAVAAGNFPPGLFSLINLPGTVAGNAFLESGINKLFFTGSVAVGKLLMAKAAERLVPVSLELGGNDAMIVCRDANLQRAVNGALWAGISNAGQSCAAVERIYVEEPVYEAFVVLLKEKMQGLKQGADQNCDVDVGAMTTKEQMKKVQDQLRDAKSKGARIFANPPSSGLNPAGLFIPPTIVEGATDDMLLMREEIFGPVLGVASVKDVDEAVRKANASTLGLTASVWSRNKKKAHAIAARLEVGSVMINDHLMSHGLAETPWGGFKESGIGRTHGYLGLEEMTQPRVVVDDMLPGMQKNMWWYPHSRKVFDGLLGGLDVLYAKRLTKRLAGIFKLVPVFLRSFQK